MTTIAIVRERWDWPYALTADRIFAVVFTGTIATAVALGLQNWAQAQEIGTSKVIDGPRAAVISTLEPVFATLTSGFVLHHVPHGPAAVGCLFILFGTLVSELAAAKRNLSLATDGNPTGV
jgi:drug/metabolite transporter (DMT)-like permease